MIYQIDDSLLAELAGQATRTKMDDSLPADLLMNLPHPCFSVESHPFSMGEAGTKHDFFFTGRFFVTTGKKGEIGAAWDHLYCLFEVPDGELLTYSLPILHGKTLGDCITALNEFHRANYNENVTEEESYLHAAPALLAAQIVLYLQAQNADTQNRPTAKKPKKKGIGKGRNQQKPTKVVDVGYHVGATIRKAQARYDSSPSSGSGTAKRPHSRRGHWHHYWTGSLSSPDERKLVLRWVEPMFIHADNSDDLPTVRKVKN